MKQKVILISMLLIIVILLIVIIFNKKQHTEVLITKDIVIVHKILTFGPQTTPKTKTYKLPAEVEKSISIDGVIKKYEITVLDVNNESVTIKTNVKLEESGTQRIADTFAINDGDTKKMTSLTTDTADYFEISLK